MLALFPALWMCLFNLTLWFIYLEPISRWVIPYLASIGMDKNCATGYFVIFSVMLAYLSLAYVVLVLTRWNGWEEKRGVDR